jgi:purine nucleoside phosphorylase
VVTARTLEGDPMTELPQVTFAHIGGSGTWGFPYPDDALGGHPYLSVRVVDPDIQVDTPFGPSPSFRRCRVTDSRSGAARDFLYVWMHGIDPARPAGQPSGVATERVFDVLNRCGVRQVIVDNSTGSIAEDLNPWDLVIVKDVIDLSGVVPRPVPPRTIRFDEPFCPDLSATLAASVEANWDVFRAVAGNEFAPKLKQGGIYVHSPGPWFEGPHEDLLYRRAGIDIVGKTGGPEYRLARMYGMRLGMLSLVVNPAEGLGEFDMGDLKVIYERCGPVMGRLVIEAIANADEAPAADESAWEPSSFQEFARFAVYGKDAAV